jgi:hypothetical protein
MTRWDLDQSNTGFRVEFRFKNEAGILLKTKTWELRREKTSPAKAMLLQCHARLLNKKPTMEMLGSNYVVITTFVSEINGELATTTFDGFHDMDKINRQVNAFPISLGVVLDSSGLHFSLHSTK